MIALMKRILDASGQYRSRIVAAIIIHQPYFFNGIFGLIQGFENLQQILGNGSVADHLADNSIAIDITMKDTQIT